MAPLLKTEELTVTYGGLRAVNEIELTVEPGRLVGLIGPNGAGKTTFIDAVTGFTRSSGRVLLEGSDVNNLAPHRRARVGLGRTWQGEELFDDLTVYDNVRVAYERLSLGAAVADLLRPRRRLRLPAVERTLERFGLAPLAERMPGELSLAHRKLVGVARTLAAEPRIVCMDEPAAGLGAAESQQLGRWLQEVVMDGVAVLLVDHDMGLVLSICEYLYVVESGELIAEGTPAEVRANPAVIASYLGDREIAEVAPSPRSGQPAA